MKVLLIFPPISVDERYSKKVGDVGGHLAPLGLAYMAAVLLKEGHEVSIIDAPALGYGMDDVLRNVESTRPDFIGMTALTTTIGRVENLSRGIKKDHPDVLLGVGGPHATIMPDSTLKRTGADFVLVGEGDITIVDILRDPGKYAMKKVIIGKRVDDLDSLPFPARHLLPMRAYKALPNTYKRSPYAINMIISRGCPFSCTYCCKDLYGYNYRARSVDNVIREIKHVIREYNTTEISFWDDLFTMKRQWVLDFCDRLIEEGIDIAWSCYSRVNFVDYEMLRKMKAAGCWNIFYGIEAGDQRLLDNIEKGITLDMSRKAVKATKAAGIEVRGSFMIALPGETPELAMKTIRFAIELDADYSQFTITTPFPGTKLYREASKWGRLSKKFDEYNEWNPVFVPFGYKNEAEVRRIHREAFRRFYFRPTYVTKRVLKIRSPGDLIRNIKGLRMILGFN